MDSAPSDGRGFALRCAVAYFAYSLIIQVAASLAYEPGGGSPGQLLSLLLLQSQNLTVALGLGLLAWCVSHHVLGRAAIAALFWGLCLAGLIDLIYYKIFLDHLRLGLVERLDQLNVNLVTGSAAHELDWVIALIAIISTAGLGYLVRQARASSAFSLGKGGVLFVTTIFLAGLPGWISGRMHVLGENPLLALGREFAGGSLLEDVRENQLVTRQQGVSEDDLLSGSVQTDPRLPSLAHRISGAGRKFNVILIVLESVGAGQLLEADGLPSPLAAPHLRKLARHAVIFDHVYVCFPGSVRSLVNLHTGGFDVSWAGIFETRYKFNGPTLAGSFANAGYRTALFSSERLDGESADIFLMQTGFQDFYDFSLHKGSLKQEEYIHSWGSVESVTLREMFQWIDRNRDSKRPFLINYMNAATHHPYGVPEGYPALFQSPNRKGRYLSSIHYTDSGIGEIVAFLKSRGLYENTILAVTGDHGQAFGEYHPRNFLHKNEVYEENVRSFLYLSNPRLTEAPVVSSRIGSMGGILPTLLDLTGIPVSPETPSRSLWPEQFPDKPVFFHELARPEKWGLRDGRWKFASTIRSGEHELYDLTADKQEQRNLAAMHRQRTEFYSALCRRWYLDAGAKFTSRLAGYRATQAPLRSWLIDPPPPGPLLLQVGTSQPGSGAIIAKERFGKDETPVAWIQWSLCKAPEPAVIEWLAPSGQTFKSEIFCPIAMVHEVVSFPGGKMNSGGWTLRLHFRNRPSLTTSFHVEAGTKVP